MKKCNKCGIQKSIEKFNKSYIEKDGLQTYCRNCQKIYRVIHKKQIAIRKKKYDETHKKETHEYYLKNKLKFAKRIKIYRKNHIKEREEYLQKYKKRIAQKANKYKKIRFKTNINYRILITLRTRLHIALKNNSKFYTTKRLIGCSIKFLKQYLEKQFKQGMSWSNYGKWHIDHIQPCASFDLSKLSEQRKCFHYTNLQPLWAEENLRKGKKYVIISS
jgi:hypothetical protein